MRRRQKFIMVCLFGVACVIFLSLSGSTTFQFTPLVWMSTSVEHLKWYHHFLNGTSHRKLTISDDNDATSSLYNDKKTIIKESRCPNILSGIIQGQWIKRPLTPQEQVTIDEYLRSARRDFKIPPTYQRADGRCGDVAYEQSPQYSHMLFKAICNPKGETPCCYTNKCINVSETDCRCATCYDERQAIHAEFAQWKTVDNRCRVKNFTTVEACSLLNGTTLHFVGDSFIRHVFAAMVVLLTNNPEGALKNNTPQKFRDQCRGLHQITGHPCRDYLDSNRVLCDGTVQVRYTEIFAVKDFHLSLPLLHELPRIQKSMAVLGLGIHDNFDIKHVSQHFLLPFFNKHKEFAKDIKSKVGINNETMMGVGNVGAGNSTFSSISKALNIWHTALPMFSNKSAKDNESFIYKKSQLNINLLPAENKTIKPIFSAISSLDVHRNQQTAQTGLSTTSNISGNTSQVGNSQEQKNYADVAQSKHSPDPVSLDFRKSPNVKADNFDISNSARVRRDADAGNSSPPIISQTSPETTADIKPWPRLLWIGAHSPGLLKSPKFSEQTAAGVQSYNKDVRKVLNDFKVPYLDTFEITKGVVSFDGTHYGYGINKLKVNMLLTYIQNELVKGSDWR